MSEGPLDRGFDGRFGLERAKLRRHCRVCLGTIEKTGLCVTENYMTDKGQRKRSFHPACALPALRRTLTDLQAAIDVAAGGTGALAVLVSSPDPALKEFAEKELRTSATTTED